MAKEKQPETLEESIAALSEAQARIGELNGELAGHRRRADAAQTALEKLQGEFGTVKTERDTAKARLGEIEPKFADLTTAAEAATRDLGASREALKTTTRDFSLRLAGQKHGVVDMDFLKLVDPALLETDDTGALKDPDALMAKLKADKPHFFAATGTPPAPPPKPKDTSVPGNPPAPGPAKSFRDMTPAEREADPGYRAARGLK